MKKWLYVVLLSSCFILSGCSEFMEAVTGINSRAKEAAEAISEDVHTLRGIEIIHTNENKATINDLIKTIVRDVQWKYEEENNQDILFVKGTWQEGLFSNIEFTEDEKNLYKENGIIAIALYFKDHALLEELTTIQMNVGDEEIIKLVGKEALQQLIKDFKMKAE